MIIKKFFLNTVGYLKIEVEGFFIQRFINLCISKDIFLDDTKHLNQTAIITKISKDDFRRVCKIAKQTKCKIKIRKKGGIPFFVHRYRKRKIFLGALIFLLAFGFFITRFIWNIDIVSDNINETEILSLLEEQGIKCGTRISKINTEQLINIIRLKREDISWVGVKIKGTNFILEIVSAEEKPEIVDESKINNIIANKKGIITKINVQSGTARVKEGDEVEEGTLLVEGIMEGKYTGIRYVNSRADIYAKITYSKEEKKMLKDTQNVVTGNEYNQYKINLNNFKINLNKGVSKFEKYDTIETKKKFRLFSNYYLPIEFEKINYKEIKKEYKQYSVEDITNELKAKLEKEILSGLENKYENFVDSFADTKVNGNEVMVVVNCVVEEKIGKNEDLVF